MKKSDENKLDDRRAKLDAALAEKNGEKNGQNSANSASGNAGWGAAVKISSEFIAGVIVGAGLGYLLDSFAGTAPWGMIVFLLLGFAAGVLNIMRATGKVAQPDNRMTSQSSVRDDNHAADSGKQE